MFSFINTFATAETAGKADLFASIGVDWKLLVLQTIAFLILLWFLKKYVYPPLVTMLDKREQEVVAAAEAAREAQARADASQDETKKLLDEARSEAKEIVSTAKGEADALVASAEAKSKAQAERVVAAAQSKIAKEVIAAKKALHNETVELVARATEKVVGKTVDARLDNAVIEESLKESQ